MLDHSADKILNYGVCTDASFEALEQNYDSVYITIYNGLTSEHVHTHGIFIVADGIGGDLGGRASDAASRVFTHHILKKLFLPSMSLDNVTQNVQSPDAIMSILRDALDSANTYIMTHLEEGIGTTLTAIIIIDAQTFVVHVGKSRVYEVTETEIICVTEDDNQIVGVHGGLSAHIQQLNISEESRLVICNDDIWSTVIEEEIRVNTLEYEPQFAANALQDISKERNPNNSISAIIIQPVVL